MTREEAIDIIKAERECVYRQGRTGECCRDDLGCGACDLVQEDTNIMESYDMAIEALKKKRPHGKWEFIGENLFKCTHCGYIADGDYLRKWKVHTFNSEFPDACLKCGAYMSKEGESK